MRSSTRSSVATRSRVRAAGRSWNSPRIGLGAGVRGWLAVGCPVCNKLVVLLLGSSGALTYFAPVQPLLGALAVILSAVALGVRLRTFFAGCRTRPAHA